MEITGKVIRILEPMCFTSKKDGQEYKKYSFVLEFISNRYAAKTVFTVFGEERWRQFNIQLGGEYTVRFDIDAREYNGKWYNDVGAWSVTMVNAPEAGYGQNQQVQRPAPQTQVAQPKVHEDTQVAEQESDLPF